MSLFCWRRGIAFTHTPGSGEDLKGLATTTAWAARMRRRKRRCAQHPCHTARAGGLARPFSGITHWTTLRRQPSLPIRGGCRQGIMGSLAILTRCLRLPREHPHSSEELVTLQPFTNTLRGLVMVMSGGDPLPTGPVLGDVKKRKVYGAKEIQYTYHDPVSWARKPRVTGPSFI
jgi:hypothetical protein